MEEEKEGGREGGEERGREREGGSTDVGESGKADVTKC